MFDNEGTAQAVITSELSPTVEHEKKKKAWGTRVDKMERFRCGTIHLIQGVSHRIRGTGLFFKTSLVVFFFSA